MKLDNFKRSDLVVLALGFLFLFFPFDLNGVMSSSIELTRAEKFAASLEWRLKLISTLPIQNSSGFSRENSDDVETLDADFIAALVAATAKQSLHFVSAVDTWSTPVFIPADCYVPLCGDEFPELDWTPTEISTLPKSRGFFFQTDEEPNYEPEDNIEFPVCCGFADTEPDQDAEAEDQCSVNPLQSCRVQEMTPPCEEAAGSCSSGSQLEMVLIFEEEVAPDTCCVTCACFGDPRCVSFEKISDIWVLCDARGPQNPNNPASVCSVREDVCGEQLDHDGNQCTWIDLTPEEQENWSTLTNGSQCIPNEASSESWLTLYEFDEFHFKARQAERGIIDKIELRLQDQVFDTTAEACFENDFNHTWTDGSGELPGELFVPPVSFVQVVVESTGIYDEVQWLVSDPVTLMHVRVRCLKQYNDDGRSSPPRIHIDALVEPEVDFNSVRNEVNGFCVTGDLGQTGSTENTEMIESGNGCAVNGKLTQTEELQVARKLCGDGLLYGSISVCVISFCEENYFPNFDDYTSCVALVGDGVDGFEFRDAFCVALTYTQIDRDDCFALWDNVDEVSGPLAAVDKYYTNNVHGAGRSRRNLADDKCIQTVDDLPSSLGECEQGVELQFLDDSFQWVTVFGFPQDNPPCDALNFNIEEHRELFENPIRLKQCTVSAACLTGTAALCSSQSGFAANFLLLPGYQIDTNNPTNNPTEGPSVAEPTTFPTESPTETEPTPFPSSSPTVQDPTPFPTNTPEPTDFPTNFPTNTPEPTDFPTNFPTDDPTAGGTNSPSNPPTEFPTRNPTPYPSEDMGMPPHDGGWGTGHPTFSPTFPPTLAAPSPTAYPTAYPSVSPTLFPTVSPTTFPTVSPTSFPTVSPTFNPTVPAPTYSPTVSPTKNPTGSPTISPTHHPTHSPSNLPTVSPTNFPTVNPTTSPTRDPTVSPTTFPSWSPTSNPTTSPTNHPTGHPTASPTRSPSQHPTGSPTTTPTESPTVTPTKQPTESPTVTPTESPTVRPTKNPTSHPTWSPSQFPTKYPTRQPTASPTKAPTESPTLVPTEAPTIYIAPTLNPTQAPTETPTVTPTGAPSISPTPRPTLWGYSHMGHSGARPDSNYLTDDSTLVSGEVIMSFMKYATPFSMQSNSGHEVDGISLEKLQFTEAGKVVFVGMYASEEAAEDEMMLSDVDAMLASINEIFIAQGGKALAVECEMVMVKLPVSDPTQEDNSEESTTDGADFLGLGAAWMSITVAVASGLLGIAITTMLIASFRSREATGLAFDYSI